jgi:DNA-directed RNA polymerase specialized sigma24 family protein
MVAARRAPERSIGRGVDVAKHARTIEKMVRAVYCDRADLDDLVQEVFLALLRKNTLPCAYDRRRGPLPKYVRLVARSTANHYSTARRRHLTRFLLLTRLPDLCDERAPIEGFEIIEELLKGEA